MPLAELVPVLRLEHRTQATHLHWQLATCSALVKPGLSDRMASWVFYSAELTEGPPVVHVPRVPELPVVVAGEFPRQLNLMIY